MVITRRTDSPGWFTEYFKQRGEKWSTGGVFATAVAWLAETRQQFVEAVALLADSIDATRKQATLATSPIYLR